MVSKFYKQLKEFRLANSLTQKEIADFLGMTPTAVSDYESGKREPSFSNIIKLADRYKLNMSWLLTGTGSMYIKDHAREATNSPPLITLPVVADIAAGTGIEAEDLPPSEFITVDPALLTLPGPYYCFKVSGTSMEPEIYTGDFAIVTGSYYNQDYNGRICAFRCIDGLILKRLYINHKAKNALLIPINPRHPITVYDDSSPEITMIGILVAIIRKY